LTEVGRIFGAGAPKTGLSASIFFAAKPQKRIFAAIQVAWASNNFAKQNYDQPLVRQRADRQVEWAGSGLAPAQKQVAGIAEGNSCA
jgi:hypothetical protein